MAESLGAGLDPDFVIIPVLEPHIRRLMQKRYSPSIIARRLPAAAAELAVLGMQLPRRLKRLLRSVEQGEINIRTHVTGLDQPIDKLDKLVTRVVWGFVTGAVIIALAVLASVYLPSR